ncbi:MAG: hypothetical protein ACK4UL_13310 [Novosphingobium meiothermophilum]|uniref:hypothetical protein n=1 Tax=Novosphingobium TaxID=165696 RepID=UPI000D6DFCB3|nr:MULTISPECIES: hypothetical protein [Novosphingobium]
MSEIFLSEEDEDRLKEAALRKVLLALTATFVAQSNDPSASLEKIRSLAKGLAEKGNYSGEEIVNEYSIAHISSVVDMFLDQIKLGGA